ncbi:MAG: hypothetical protein GY786_24115, partial [Proteobacteria bacterium]|nr:hypothetical protein [Pseudomonadota bacterium]
MFNSLYSKIAAGLALLFLIVGVFFIGITVFSTDMYQQEVNQKLNTNLAQQIVKERLLMKDGQVDESVWESFEHEWEIYKVQANITWHQKYSLEA